jgi:hypothetical protein
MLHTYHIIHMQLPAVKMLQLATSQLKLQLPSIKVAELGCAHHCNARAAGAWQPGGRQGQRL